MHAASSGSEQASVVRSVTPRPGPCAQGPERGRARERLRHRSWAGAAAARTLLALLVTLAGCSPPEDGETPLESDLECSGTCAAGVRPGTLAGAPPLAQRLHPACATFVVDTSMYVTFKADALFLPELDGSGAPLPPATASRVTWYLDDLQIYSQSTTGPWTWNRTFSTAGTFVVRARVSDSTQSRYTDLEWTIVAAPNASMAGSLGGPAPAPYYCYAGPGGAAVDLVRGESRRVWTTTYDAGNQLTDTDWYLAGALAATQTIAATPHASARAASFYHDLLEATPGTRTLESRAHTTTGNSTQSWTVTTRQRGRGLDVESLDTLLTGTDPNAQVTALLAFIDTHAVNAVTLFGVEPLLVGGRCQANPSNPGCMPLAALMAGLETRAAETSVDVTSATGLADIEAFIAASPPGYIDGLTTRCAFWDAATACFAGAFDDGNPADLDSYMDLVRAMNDTGLVVSARADGTRIEQLSALRDVADRVLLTGTQSGEPTCHYRQLDDQLEAIARDRMSPVQVWVAYDASQVAASACGAGPDPAHAPFTSLEAQEEDFYARLRGEGLKDCTWPNARPHWIDGVRVTGFQHQSYAALTAKLADADCDGIDDDCDNSVDEGFVTTMTSCGVGACASEGTSTCSAGAVVDSCVPITGSPDVDCDGLDDDCDGLADDAFVPGPVCDFGYMPAQCGQTTCVDGVLGDNIARPSCDPEMCEITPTSQCEQPGCVESACALIPVPDGTPCAENMGTLCVAGACVPPGCGNGYRESTESCDDGNLLNGDACTSTCAPDVLLIDGSLTGAYDPVPTVQASVFTADGAGNLLAVWIRDDYASEALHARRYSRGGVSLEPLDPMTMEQGTLPLDEALFRPSNADPVVAGLADGGWVVVWSTLRGGSRDIVYRVVHPNGILDPERIANVDREGTQWRPAVAATSEGFVIAWVDTYETLADPYDGVRARRFGSNGLPLAGPIYLATDRSDWESRVAIAGDHTTTLWAAAWTQGFDTRIQVRRFNGALAVDATEYDASGHLSDRPVITSLANGEFVVAWESYAADGEGDVESRVLDAASGNPLMESILAHAGVMGEGELRPVVARWNPGTYVIQWWTPDSAAGGSGTYVSPDVTGFPWAEVFAMSPRVGQGDDGGWGLTWVPDGMWLTWREYIDPYFTPALTGIFLPRSAP